MVNNNSRIDQMSSQNTGSLLNNNEPSANPDGLLFLLAPLAEPATDHILALPRLHRGNEILQNTVQLSADA